MSEGGWVDKWHYQGGLIAVQARDQVAGLGGVSTLQPRQDLAMAVVA
jgi:hypothetical protein